MREYELRCEVYVRVLFNGRGGECGHVCVRARVWRAWRLAEASCKTKAYFL